MPAPAFGALGMTFTVVRGMQAACLISIIGMTANFISEMVSADNTPPSVLIGTLSVVSSTQSSLYTAPITSNIPTDMHSSPLLRHNLHPLLRLHPPLPHLHRPRRPPPHSRDRRRRNDRQAPLIPELCSPIQRQRQHDCLRRLRRPEYGQCRLLCLGGREQHDLL